MPNPPHPRQVGNLGAAPGTAYFPQDEAQGRCAQGGRAHRAGRPRQTTIGRTSRKRDGCSGLPHSHAWGHVEHHLAPTSPYLSGPQWWGASGRPPSVPPQVGLNPKYQSPLNRPVALLKARKENQAKNKKNVLCNPMCPMPALTACLSKCLTCQAKQDRGAPPEQYPGIGGRGTTPVVVGAP